jgi:hypothetical protein
MDRIQCTSCKRQKFVSDFLKNGKTLKTCITCRAPKRSVTVDSVVKPKSVSKTAPKVIPITVPTVNPAPVVIPEPIKALIIQPKNRWKYLSGKWIHEGEERKLHEQMMKKMNRDFQERAAFAVHKYLTRWVMVDIRDL